MVLGVGYWVLGGASSVFFVPDSYRDSVVNKKKAEPKVWPMLPLQTQSHERLFHLPAFWCFGCLFCCIGRHMFVVLRLIHFRLFDSISFHNLNLHYFKLNIKQSSCSVMKYHSWTSSRDIVQTTCKPGRSAKKGRLWQIWQMYRWRLGTRYQGDSLTNNWFQPRKARKF